MNSLGLDEDEGLVETTLLALDACLAPDGLSNFQESFVRGCLEGQTYSQIAEATGYDDDYIRDVGFKLWRQLSKALGKKVSKGNFKTVLRHYSQKEAASSPSAKALTALGLMYDWGTAADVPLFYGRESEADTLTQWVQTDRCRLISILGMGGMGKTSFTIRLAQTLQPNFEALVWRSLKALSVSNILLKCLVQLGVSRLTI